MVEITDERVQPALHAMLVGDAAGLQAVIDADPEIVTLRWGENTLLEWVTQPPHGVTADVAEVLIASGSALDRALNLAGCWNLDRLCVQLLAAGADPAARVDAGITPLESAAMHGATKSADALVASGLHRPSLWLAAAAGRLDRVEEWVTPDGILVGDPGPYRPDLSDVGHPSAPARTDDPIEVIGEALVFAGANDRMDVVDYLLAGDADINSRPYLNTTALHLAILFRNPDAVSGLIRRGAAASIRDDRYDSDAHGWAQACLDEDNPASVQIAELIAG